MSKNYTIEYKKVVVKDHIPKLDKSVKEIIKLSIETKLATDPIKFGKPLQYSLKGYRRLRVGNYRVIYKINPVLHLVTVIMIKHRKDIYE